MLLARLGAHAHADELNFRDDEAVAAPLLAHVPLQLCEPGQIKYFTHCVFVAHPRVPVIVGFDNANDATAVIGAGEGLLHVGSVIGDEAGAVIGRVLWAHGDVAGMALAGFESGVHLCGIEFGQEVLKEAVCGRLEG